MPHIKSEKGFVPILFIFVLTILVGTGALSSQIKTTTEYPQYIVQAQVLGDVNELTEAEKEELKQKEEDRLKEKEEMKKLELEKMEKKKQEQEALLKENELKKEEMRKKEEQLKLEKQRSKELKARIEELRRQAEKNRSPKPTIMPDPKESSETAELEAQLKMLEKELKENDGKVEYEQSLGDLKIKYSFENGKLVVKAQAEGGAEIEVDDAEIKMIKAQLEQQLKDSGIEIGTSSSKLTIGKNKIKAKTNFPISVDPETNQLMVTTPAGQKIVTVLPDQAIQNMLSKKVITEVEFTNSTNEDSSEIELENRIDQMVYKIKGKKEHKLIGFIPVKTETTAYVSAENGEVVAKDESLLSKLIDLISL